MAVDIAEELRRSQIADALSLLGLNDSTPPSTDDTDTASSKSGQLDVPKHVADHFGNPNDWPTVYDTTTQQAVGAPSPEPDIQQKLEPLTSESVGISLPEAPASATPPPAPIESEYVGIEPDRPTLFGGQYSKDAFKAPEKQYPTVAEDQGAELPADALPQVERATLVKLPDKPAPDVLPQVEKALPAAEPAPGKLAQVERALPTGPKAPGAHTDLAAPGQMDLREDTDQPTATGKTQLPNAPIDQTKPTQLPNAPLDQAKQTQLPNAPVTQSTVKVNPRDPSTWPNADGSPVVVATKLATQPDGISGLAQSRNRIAQEMADNPDLARKLMASIQAEVGDQGAEAKIAYTESVMNRAIARNMTLDQTISDLHYYPITTTSKLGRSVSRSEVSYLSPIIKQVLGGSNLSNFATGNESGNVHSGGAPVRYDPRTGERFVRENSDEGWEKNIAGSETQASAVKKNAWDDWPDVAPAAVATAQAQTGKEFDTLNAIRDRTPNVGALWKTLNSPIAGVSDNARTQYLTQAKKGITDYALDYYKESHPGITPDEAFKLATGDADFGTLAGEVSTKIIPNLQSAAISLNRAPQTVDENRINDFLNVVNPNLTPEQRIEFKRDTMSTLAAMNPTKRAQYIGNMVATDPQKFAGFDVAALADSFDRISNPAYQAKFKSDMDLAVAKNKHDLATDPRLVGKAAEGVTQFLASVPKNLAETFSGPIGQSAMLSEIYFNTADQLRHEHPDWSEDDVKQKASASTLAQLGPQELLMRVTGGLLGAATKGITNPLMEFGARYGLHGTVAAVAGGVQQMGKNLAEGRPMMDGVPEAAGSAAPYGLVGAAVGGRHYPEPGPEPTVMEPNLNTGKVHGPPEPAADTGFVHGPSGELMAAPEDTGAMHGPRLEETGLSHGPPEPRDTRRIFGPPAPRTTFTPAELAEQVGAMRGKTPEELAAEAQTISPPVDMTARDVGDRGPSTQVQEARAQAQVEQQTLGQRVARLSIVQRSVFNDLRRDGMTPEEALPRVERSTKTSYPDVRADALAPLVKAQPKAVLADQIKRSRIAQGLGVKEVPAPEPAPVTPKPYRPGSADDPTLQALRAKQPHIYARDAQGREDVAMIVGDTAGGYKVMMPRQGMHDPDKVYATREEAQSGARDAFEKSGWKVSFDPREAVPAAGFPTPAHASVYRDLVSTGMDEARARDFVSKANGNTPAEILADVQTQMRGPAPSTPGSPTPQPATPIEKNPGHPEPWVSEIANRFIAERVAKGDIGPVEPGHGETTEALVARGTRMNPEQIAQHISNLRNNVGGDPTDQAAAVRVEEARLSHRSHQLSKVAEADPTNQQARDDADEAFRFVTDFHTNVVVKLKKNWNKIGMTLQGSMPVDLSTFNGQREEYLHNTDKAPMPDTEKVLKRNAQKVRDATAAEQASLRKLGAEVDRQSARRNLPTHEQNKETVARRMRGEFPCPT